MDCSFSFTPFFSSEQLNIYSLHIYKLSLTFFLKEICLFPASYEYKNTILYKKYIKWGGIANTTLPEDYKKQRTNKKDSIRIYLAIVPLIFLFFLFYLFGVKKFRFSSKKE
jgi:hypothetical protein